MSVTLPEPISVVGKDYVVQIKAKMTTPSIVMLYNEKGQSNRSYGALNGYCEGAALGVVKVSDGIYLITITKSKLKSSTNGNNWTNGEATAITKIGFDSTDADKSVTILEVTLIESIGLVSGGEYTNGSETGKCVDKFNGPNTSADFGGIRYGVAGGVLSHLSSTAGNEFTTVYIWISVELTESRVINPDTDTHLRERETGRKLV